MPDSDTLKDKAKAPSGKLAVDLASIPRELQDRAPKTAGEKHFDRTIAVGLFFAIYAASVGAAIVIKKHPWGNQKFYTPLKNAFRSITNRLYGSGGLLGDYAKESETLVETGAAKDLLAQVKRILWDIEVADGTATESARQFNAVFKQHEGLLKDIQTALEQKHGIDLTKSIGELLKDNKVAGSVRGLLASLEGELQTGAKINEAGADAATQLKAVLRDYKLDKQTEDLSEIISLSMGGNAIVFPYKLYDDRRHKSIIQEYDKANGTGIDDPLMSAAAQARVANMATQSWTSATLTRIGALGVLVATAYTPWLGETIIGAQKTAGAKLMEAAPAKKFMDWIGKLKLDWYPYRQTEKGLDAASVVSKQYTGEMVAADMTWTMYTTALMLGIGGILAPLIGNKSKDKIGNYTRIEPVPAAGPRHEPERAPEASPTFREVPVARAEMPTTRVAHTHRESALASHSEHATGV